MKRNLLLSTLLLASASMAAQGFDGSFDELGKLVILMERRQ